MYLNFINHPMKYTNTLPLVITLGFFFGAVNTSYLYANPDGFTGVTSTGCGGNKCHGTQPSNLTTVLLEGNRVVKPNTLNTFTLRVRNSNAIYAGFNLAAFTKNGQPSGLLQYPTTENQYVKSQNGELTHRARRTMSNQGSYREASWQVQWRSPDTPGEYILRAVGNAADGDGRASAGDMWNFLSPTTITVQGIVLTEPTASRSYCAGDTVTISWISYGVTTVNILYTADSGRSWIPVGTVPSQAGTNSYQYIIPATVTSGNRHLLRVVNADDELLNATTPPLTLNPRTAIRTQPTSPPAQCEGGSISLSLSATGGDLRYQWKHNSIPLPGATAAQLQLTNIQPNQAGQYTCEVTGACGSVTSNEVSVTVIPKPTITQQTPDTTVHEGQRLELYAEATPSTGCTYQWFKNGTAVSGATGNRFIVESATAEDAGTYTLKVSNTCGTAESAPIRVQIAPQVSVENNPLRAALRVYPQPASHVVVIESPAPLDQLALYDIHGRLVRQFENHSTMTTRLEIPLHEEHGARLPEGIYFLKCQVVSSPANGMQQMIWYHIFVQ